MTAGLRTGGQRVRQPVREGPVADGVRQRLERVGITDFRWHDLRHCYGSYLGMVGVNQKALMELMGHKDAKMTLRYTHLSDEYKRQAVGRLAAIGDLESPQNPPSADEANVVSFAK